MEEKEKLVFELKKRNMHISTAESCTAGLVAATIVDVSGASEVFEEGYITYSDHVKHKVLGVPKDVLKAYTAVSRQTAQYMAKGVHDVTGAELTVSVTGYAGPLDAEDGTKAGTVYIGTWYQQQLQVKEFHFAGDRRSVRTQAAKEAVRFALERIMQSE